MVEEKVLGPGDTAPKIEVAEWVKGEKVEKFEKGQVYVVEFWATWCGPCIETIPHLTALQKKYGKKVKFTGVSIWEDGEDVAGQVKKFVVDMGEKMEYSVARDTDAGVMASKWMEAAMQMGIPTAFIVKGDQIQWVGHPAAIDEPLEQVVEGKFDLAASRKLFDAEVAEAKADVEKRKKIAAAMIKLREDYAAGKKKEAFEALDKLALEDPSVMMEKDLIKLELLASDDVPGAKKLVDELVKSGDKDPNGMMGVGLFAMQESNKEGGNVEVALYAADKTIANTESPFAIYYASFAYNAAKKHKQELKALQTALDKFDASPFAKDEQMASFKSAIEKRLKEAKKKAS